MKIVVISLSFELQNFPVVHVRRSDTLDPKRFCTGRLWLNFIPYIFDNDEMVCRKVDIFWLTSVTVTLDVRSLTCRAKRGCFHFEYVEIPRFVLMNGVNWSSLLDRGAPLQSEPNQSDGTIKCSQFVAIKGCEANTISVRQFVIHRSQTLYFLCIWPVFSLNLVDGFRKNWVMSSKSQSIFLLLDSNFFHTSADTAFVTVHAFSLRVMLLFYSFLSCLLFCCESSNSYERSVTSYGAFKLTIFCRYLKCEIWYLCHLKHFAVLLCPSFVDFLEYLVPWDISCLSTSFV